MFNFQSDLHVVNVLKFIEKSIGYKKGKGVKSKTVITVVESKNVSHTDSKQYCSSPEGSPPHLLLFMDGGECKSWYVLGDDCTISFKNRFEDVLCSVIVLVGSYYCFDLTYPRVYSQLLGLLQQYILKDPYNLDKSMEYKHFVAKYESKIKGADKSNNTDV